MGRECKMRPACPLRSYRLDLLYYSLVVSGLAIQLVDCLGDQANISTGSLGLPINQSNNTTGNGRILTSIKRSVDDSQHEDQKCSTVAAGFLLAGATDSRLNLSDPIDRNLFNILKRDGPDTRPSRDYRDFKTITLDVSKRAWSLLHEHISLAVRKQVDSARPAIRELITEAKVSKNCTESIEGLLDGATRMESWAIMMLNSWGQFPMAGIYDGTYSSLGAFHTCVGAAPNRHIGHAHYCSVAFRPVMPSQKDYELIVRPEPEELRLMFEKLHTFASINFTTDPGSRRDQSSSSSSDALTDILEHAQYHHYLYYKWGTCWPIKCSPFDVRRVAKLFGRKSILMSGPVKCYSRDPRDYEQPDDADDEHEPAESPTGQAHVEGTNIEASSANRTQSKVATKKRKLLVSTWDKNNGIFVWKPHFYRAHKIALSIVLAVSALIISMTLIDIAFVRLPPLYRKLTLCFKGMPLTHNGAARKFDSFALCANLRQAAAAAAAEPDAQMHPTRAGFAMVPGGTDELATPADTQPEEEFAVPPGLFMSFVRDCSVVTNLPQFFSISENQLKNDILCLNGVRCITMMWIILTHTMMYHDWSAFGRTREIEKSVKSLANQPIFNGSYLVDTFFLMSGLLSAYTAFRHCQGDRRRFRSLGFILGRWLRLTPQVFFVSMIYIFFPALNYGPHWFTVVGEFSENCVKNWWVNVFHMQAFYRKDEMCNFVTWWISIDFLYHFLALAVIWIIILAGHKLGSLSLAGIVGGAVLWQSVRHYSLGLPPNILSTIPQTGAMWTSMTLDFFWTPFTHSVPFFFGFYTGYLMALKRKLIVRSLNTRRALIGWLLSVSLLVGQSYSTYWWVTGEAGYTRAVSTLFFAACSFIWSGSICWIVIACQHGYGGFINRALSWRVFIVLGKSSYMIYLSHFMVLFMFFGSQNLILEPSTLNMLYIVIGNVFMSTLLGIVLCACYEIPWLKMHKRLLRCM